MLCVIKLRWQSKRSRQDLLSVQCIA